MRTVLAHGVFDILHAGHIQHLQQAAAFGDYLIVSVVPDKFVKKARSPYVPEEDRVFLLQALYLVDEVVLCGGIGPEKILRTYLPDIYVRGSEYVKQDMPEYALCKKLGIQVGFTKPIALHTSDLVKRIKACDSTVME